MPDPRSAGRCDSYITISLRSQARVPCGGGIWPLSARTGLLRAL